MSEVSRAHGVQQPRQLQQRRQLRQLTATANGTMPEAGRLREACQAIEGLFLAQLLSELDRPVFGGGLLDSSVTRQVFRAQRNSALGAELGRRGALGLAKLLGAELGREGIVRGGDSG